MNQNEPLGLPKGSVRAILALLMILIIFILMIKRIDIPEALWVAAAGLWAMYYIQKQSKPPTGGA